MSSIRSSLRFLILIPVYVLGNFTGKLTSTPKPWKYVACTLAFVGFGLVLYRATPRYTSNRPDPRLVAIGLCLLLLSYGVATLATRWGKR